MPRKAQLALAFLAAALALPSPVGAVASARVAALQVGLRTHGLYAGPVDGVAGPATTASVRALQRRAGLVVDGVAGPQTRGALGRYGRRLLGRRVLVSGQSGWDVAELQFLLARHGFPSGTFDGVFGPHTERAMRRFQRWKRLAVDGRAGPSTLALLRLPPARAARSLAWPLSAPVADSFGPRGARFHTGIDLPSAVGTPVRAAAAGRVAYAGWLGGGWGLLVLVAHGGGLRTLYAHLSQVDVRVGDTVTSGSPVGRVGATGDATGPHLHFEVRFRGAAIDPLPLLH